MSTLERVFLVYLLLMVGVGLSTPSGGDLHYEPGLHTLTIGALIAAQVAGVLIGRRVAVWQRRWLRAVLACVSVPVAFSAMGFLLPAIHPEPYEWRFHALDQRVFAGHPTVWLQPYLWPPFTELLQWIYAAFYLIPAMSAVLVARARGGAAFDRAMTILVLGFLCSYLGYLLWPTIGPEYLLDHGPALQGVWLEARIHAAIAAAEANIWDCFPSGHTMLSLMSLMVLWRWARPAFWLMLPVVGLLVFSTVALRYHWVWDVLAGAALAWPSLRLGDLLLDRDGALPA